MKKVFFVILLIAVFITTSAFAQTAYVDKIDRSDAPAGSLVIASWNACKFGKSKTDDTMGFMADILAPADIVAIQEVSTSQFGAQAMAKLCDALNRRGAKWDYSVSDPTHQSPSKERFGFLWKTSSVQAIAQKPVLVSGLAAVMEREPAVMHFRTGEKKISVASFHLAPTDKHPENEVTGLAANRNLFVSPELVFVGDWNLSFGRIEPFIGPTFGMLHLIDGKTSLRQAAGEDGYLSQAFDNIFIAGRIKIWHAGIVDFVPRFSDLAGAREISDHLPVYAVLVLD